ncbi:MAG: diaminopimelate decarboxylase [Candidatus Methylacidiphilales bacterium]|nr:diaminopimelate decarboxylase [Candidatus Methylacidiphilales bacterium]
MHHFSLQDGDLFVEGCRVSDIAREHGSPLYIYSAATITDNYDALMKALAPLDPMICFAMKANSTLAVLNLLAKRGCGFDLVSGGELFRVKKAGGASHRCTFAGVGKTRAEIEQAILAGVYSFNVESVAEMETINRIAGEMKQRAPVAVRVNPNVDAGTHAKITTGTYENKFGIAFEEVPSLYEYAASSLKNLELRGVQMHIGSQITETAPFVKAIQKMLPMVKELKRKHDIKFFDIGGGMGIVYQDALASGKPDWWKQHPEQMTPATYAAAVVPLLKDLGLRILLEPGRFLTGNSGILVTEVLYVKNTGAKNFAIVDAAMNDLIRPAFYDSYHEIIPLTANREGADKLVATDVVGPVCESGDYFTKDRMLPVLRAGDKVALMSAGAYGFVMSSNYNTRPRPPEILVHGNKATTVRKREAFEDLVRGESI